MSLVDPYGTSPAPTGQVGSSDTATTQLGTSRRDYAFLGAMLKGSGTHVVVSSTLPVKPSGAVGSLEGGDVTQGDLGRLRSAPMQTSSSSTRPLQGLGPALGAIPKIGTGWGMKGLESYGSSVNNNW